MHHPIHCIKSEWGYKDDDAVVVYAERKKLVNKI